MKYLSIDLETTGLNSDKCQVLEVSFILEDTNLNLPIESLPFITFRIEHKEIHGEPYAISMPYNSYLIDQMKKKPKDRDSAFWVKPEQVYEQLMGWLMAVGQWDKTKPSCSINVAGKNFASFDRPFLENLLKNDKDYKSQIRFRYRVLDPSILFADLKNDDTLPDLEQCKVRAGFKETNVSHSSYEDALDVIKLIRIGTSK